jgi:hypothetical protein
VNPERELIAGELFSAILQRRNGSQWFHQP